MWIRNKAKKIHAHTLSSDEEVAVLLRRVSFCLVLISVFAWLIDYLTKGLIFFYFPFGILVAADIVALSVFIYCDQKALYPKIIAWKHYPRLYSILVQLLLVGLFSLSLLQALTLYDSAARLFAVHQYWLGILEAILFAGSVLLSYFVLALKFIESKGRLVNHEYGNGFTFSVEDTSSESRPYLGRVKGIILSVAGHKYFDFLMIALLFVVFLAYRIYVIFRFPMNFPDEFTHAIVGLELFKTEHFPILYNSGKPYMRGSYVSALAGLFLTLIGKHIWVIKVVPLLIGAIDFWLVKSISKRVISNKNFIYVVLLLFIINPWIALNHFYLRLYVFYELFLLLTVFLLIKMLELFNWARYWKAAALFLIFLLAIYINYFWSFDEGKQLNLLSAGVGFVFILLSQRKMRLNPRNLVFRKIREIIMVGPVYKLLFVVTILMYLFFRYDFLAKVNFLLTTQLIGSFYRQSYLELFYNNQLILSLLFVISLTMLYLIYDGAKRLVIVIAIALIAIHFLSGPGLQIIRGLLYFIPLFIIISVMALDYIASVYSFNSRPIFHRLVFVLVVAVAIFSTVKTYPEDFSSKGFSLSGDLWPNNYQEVYRQLELQYPDHKIIQVGYNTPAFEFFGRKIEYEVDLTHQLVDHFAMCKDGDKTFECYFNIPVITQTEDAVRIMGNDKYCLITNDYRNRDLLTPEFRKQMLVKLQRTKLTDYDLYCN
ncbi:MAG: hypothetical protein WCT32_03610 [Patescibacteria group bacterium]|jgi:hypothetical protein